MPNDSVPGGKVLEGVVVPDRVGEEGRVFGRLPVGVAQPLLGVIHPGVFQPLDVPLRSSSPIRLAVMYSMRFL